MKIEEITWANSQFPEKLKEIPNPPKHIYYSGNRHLLTTPCLAIVGSRKGTEYGQKMANYFAQELGKYALTIVSGLAIGIDAVAHEGALKETGRTIAVLPNGINQIYPPENKELARRIVQEDGLILSEYPPDEKAKQEYFLARNRIVCGLSIGTLIIEGAIRSGTSVTAKLTKQQGKPIFCVPCSLDNPKGYTPNHLIQQGSFLVMKVEDIIQKFPNYHFQKKKRKKVIEEKEHPILCWFTDSPIHINQLAEKTGKRVEELSYPLMKLQLEGKIQELAGKNFIRKD